MNSYALGNLAEYFRYLGYCVNCRKKNQITCAYTYGNEGEFHCDRCYMGLCDACMREYDHASSYLNAEHFRSCPKPSVPFSLSQFCGEYKNTPPTQIITDRNIIYYEFPICSGPKKHINGLMVKYNIDKLVILGDGMSRWAFCLECYTKSYRRWRHIRGCPQRWIPR